MPLTLIIIIAFINTIISHQNKFKKSYFFHYYRDIIQFFDPIILPDGTRTGSMDVLLAHLLAVDKMLPVIRCDFHYFACMFHYFIRLDCSFFLFYSVVHLYVILIQPTYFYFILFYFITSHLTLSYLVLFFRSILSLL